MHVVKTYSLHRLKILSYRGGRHVFAQYGPIEGRPIVTSRFTEGRKRSEQKLAKVAKVRHLPSEKLFFRHGHSPALTHRAISRRRLPQKTAISRELGCAQISLDPPTARVLTPLQGTAFQQEPPLLPLLPSVQSSSSLPSVHGHALWLRLRRPVVFDEGLRPACSEDLLIPVLYL